MFANEYGGEGRFPLPLKGRTLDIKAGSLSLEDFLFLVRLFILHPIFLLGSLYWYTKKKREKKERPLTRQQHRPIYPRQSALKNNNFEKGGIKILQSTIITLEF